MNQVQSTQPLDFSVEDLPLDVFDLADSGLEIESLTAGLGMAENAASYYSPSGCVCSGGCSGNEHT